MLNGSETFPVEQNQYRELFVDLTYRCNMNCHMCYSVSPKVDIPDMSYEYFAEVCKRLPNPTTIVMVGGEPTLHPKFFDFIAAAHGSNHDVFLSTNGIKFSRDAAYTREFARVAKAGKTRIHMDMSGGRDNKLYKAIHNKECYEIKIGALEAFKENRIGRVLVAAVLVRGLNESVVPEIFSIAKDYRSVVRAVKFRAQGHNGRFIEEQRPYTINEIIKMVSKYIPKEDIFKNVTLAGFTDDRCQGKHCCFHFKPSRELEVDLLECFPKGKYCWRKGHLTPDFRVRPVFEDYQDVAQLS